MRINYLANFKEDRRLSMDNYVDDLFDYQTKNTKFEINKFIPKINSIYRILPELWMLRAARYISYSNLIKRLPHYDITHVIDHSYAHLVKNIKSKVKILTVHDLIPIIFEQQKIKDIYNLETNKNLNKKYLFRYSLKFFKYYDKIITPSSNTKKDILKFTDCPEHKLHVLHLNIPKDDFNNNEIQKELICKKYNISLKSKKILISGNGFYKNHITSIKVLENLLKKKYNVCLIWIGYKGELKHIEYKNFIHKLPIIKKNELPSIYKICDILLFPSLYEGMGILPIEAMKTGIPIVTSNTSSIPEIVGDAGIKCDPTDVNLISQKIIHLLSDEKYYNQKVKEGLERAKLFNYDNMHKQILNIYKEELSKKYLN